MIWRKAVNQYLKKTSFSRRIYSEKNFNIFIFHYLIFKNYNYICTRLSN